MLDPFFCDEVSTLLLVGGPKVYVLILARVVGCDDLRVVAL
jgi:hypothetical protein